MSTVAGRPVALGNLARLEGLGIALDDLPRRAEELRGEGHTKMLVAIGGKAAGLLGTRRRDAGREPPLLFGLPKMRGR